MFMINTWNRYYINQTLLCEEQFVLVEPLDQDVPGVGRMIFTSPPEGVRSIVFTMSVCVCVCLSVCPANILIFYFSAIRRDIDLKFIQENYRVLPNSLIKLTFIDQRSRSQGRYFALWSYSLITKTEPLYSMKQ